MKSNFFFEFLKMTPRSYLTHQILLFKILTSHIWAKQNDENQFFNNQNNPMREEQIYSSCLAETMNCTLTTHSKARADGSLAQPDSNLSSHPTHLQTCWRLGGTGEAVPAENQFRSVNHSRVSKVLQAFHTHFLCKCTRGQAPWAPHSFLYARTSCSLTSYGSLQSHAFLLPKFKNYLYVICNMCVCPTKSRQGVGSPEDEVIARYESPNVVARN